MLTRAEAHAAGEKFYTEPRGCLNGHIPAKRYVSTGGCVDCLRKYKTIKPQRVIVPPHLLQAFHSMCSALGVTVMQPGDPEQALSNTPLHDPAAVVRSPFQAEIDRVRVLDPRYLAR